MLPFHMVLQINVLRERRATQDARKLFLPAVTLHMHFESSQAGVAFPAIFTAVIPLARMRRHMFFQS